MNFGAFVASRDNDSLGTFERVVLDLTTNEVLGYVVHKTANRNRDVVVPSSAVSEVDDALVLNLSLSEVENLPDYFEASRTARPGLEGPLPVLPDTVEVSAQTKVECIDGEVGAIEGVIVDEFTDEVTDLIVRLKDGRRSATVPLAWASSLRDDVIKLQCARSEL